MIDLKTMNESSGSYPRFELICCKFVVFVIAVPGTAGDTTMCSVIFFLTDTNTTTSGQAQVCAYFVALMVTNIAET